MKLVCGGINEIRVWFFFVDLSMKALETPQYRVWLHLILPFFPISFAPSQSPSAPSCLPQPQLRAQGAVAHSPHSPPLSSSKRHHVIDSVRVPFSVLPSVMHFFSSLSSTQSPGLMRFCHAEDLHLFLNLVEVDYVTKRIRRRLADRKV